MTEKTLENKFEEPNAKNVDIGDSLVNIVGDKFGREILIIYPIVGFGNNSIFYYERGACLAYKPHYKLKELPFENLLILKRNGTYLLGSKIYRDEKMQEKLE